MATGKNRYTGMVNDSSGDYDSYRGDDGKEVLVANATGKRKGAAGAGRGFINPPTVEEERKEEARRKVADEMNGGRGTEELLPGEKFKKGGSVKPRGWGIARHK